MSLPYMCLSLMAQLSNWKHLGDGLRGSSKRFELSDIWPYALAAVVVGAGIATYTSWKRRNDFNRRCSDPLKLFRELCAIHQLNRTNQGLLKQLAEELQLRQPAQVFLMPSKFSKPGLPEALHANADEYAALGERLF